MKHHDSHIPLNPKAGLRGTVGLKPECDRSTMPDTSVTSSPSVTELGTRLSSGLLFPSGRRFVRRPFAIMAT
jgi:hypothetical protein